MAKIIKGKPVVEKLSKQQFQQVENLKGKGINPCLAILRVGDHPDDISYERGILKQAEKIGIKVQQFLLPENISEKNISDIIQQINMDQNIHGCLLFRPLPNHLNTGKISNLLRPEKDVDGMTAASLGNLLTKANIGFAPCTAAACLALLDFYEIPIKGKKTVVIGRSATVGYPTVLLLLNRDAAVSVCHSHMAPEDVIHYCQEADILISAVGRHNLVGPEHVHSGQVVVDVGINFTEDGKICGDVNFERVEPIVEAITPVPGGIGAITSTIISCHVVEAASRLLSGESKYTF